MNRELTVCVVGAGSSYTPELVAGILAQLPEQLPITRLRLHDLNSERLGIMAGLMTAPSPYSLLSAQRDREYWGRLVESAIGAHLLNSTRGKKIEIFYWLERNQEVDFLMRSGKDLVCLEVKSGRVRQRLSGMMAFTKAFKVKRQLLIGQEGIPLKDFLPKPVEHWFE